MFFDDASGIWRVLIVGPLAYLWLVLILRITGKRTLAQLNAFDFIVTVALGSTLATIVLTDSVAWVEGALALALLALLQLTVAWLSVHIPFARKALTSQPSLLLHNGTMLPEALRAGRISEASVRQAVRNAGVGGLDLVAAVVLETNGTLSVITTAQLGTGTALDGLTPPTDTAPPDVAGPTP